VVTPGPVGVGVGLGDPPVVVSSGAVDVVPPGVGAGVGVTVVQTVAVYSMAVPVAKEKVW